MFWQKKAKFDWPLMFFVFIALGIILSIAVLVVILVGKSKGLGVDFNPASVSSRQYHKQVVLVEQNYQQVITKLQSAVSAEKNLNNIYTAVDAVFLQVPVPAEMRDQHLQTLLKIHELKGQNLSLEIVKTQIKDMLGGITKRL